MKRIALFLFLILSVINCFAQTQIDPTYQIQWNSLSGSGAPSISCTQNGNYTVYPYGAEWGQPYQDTTNNVEYKCTASGWVKNLPITGGTLTGPISFSNNSAANTTMTNLGIAQTGTPGTSSQVDTFPGTVAAGTAITSPLVNNGVSACYFSGSTADVKIANAFASLPLSLGKVDASCLGTTTQVLAGTISLTAGQELDFSDATTIIPASVSSDVVHVVGGSILKGLHVGLGNYPITYSGSAVSFTCTTGGPIIGPEIDNLSIDGATSAPGIGLLINCPTLNYGAAYTHVNGMYTNGVLRPLVLSTSNGGWINANEFKGLTFLAVSTSIPATGITLLNAGNQIEANTFEGFFEGNGTPSSIGISATTTTTATANIDANTFNFNIYDSAYSWYVPSSSVSGRVNVNWVQGLLNGTSIDTLGADYIQNYSSDAFNFYTLEANALTLYPSLTQTAIAIVPAANDTRAEVYGANSSNSAYMWKIDDSGNAMFSSIIPTNITPSTSPVCANGTGGALTTTGCTGGSYLPLSGGTLTGALTGTSASFSGTVAAGSAVTGNLGSQGLSLVTIGAKVDSVWNNITNSYTGTDDTNAIRAFITNMYSSGQTVLNFPQGKQTLVHIPGSFITGCSASGGVASLTGSTNNMQVGDLITFGVFANCTQLSGLVPDAAGDMQVLSTGLSSTTFQVAIPYHGTISAQSESNVPAWGVAFQVPVAGFTINGAQSSGASAGSTYPPAPTASTFNVFGGPGYLFQTGMNKIANIYSINCTGSGAGACTVLYFPRPSGEPNFGGAGYNLIVQNTGTLLDGKAISIVSTPVSAACGLVSCWSLTATSGQAAASAANVGQIQDSWANNTFDEPGGSMTFNNLSVLYVGRLSNGQTGMVTCTATGIYCDYVPGNRAFVEWRAGTNQYTNVVTSGFDYGIFGVGDQFLKTNFFWAKSGHIGIYAGPHSDQEHHLNFQSYGTDTCLEIDGVNNFVADHYTCEGGSSSYFPISVSNKFQGALGSAGQGMGTTNVAFLNLWHETHAGGSTCTVPPAAWIGVDAEAGSSAATQTVLISNSFLEDAGIGSGSLCNVPTMVQYGGVAYAPSSPTTISIMNPTKISTASLNQFVQNTGANAPVALVWSPDPTVNAIPVITNTGSGVGLGYNWNSLAKSNNPNLTGTTTISGNGYLNIADDGSVLGNILQEWGAGSNYFFVQNQGNPTGHRQLQGHNATGVESFYLDTSGALTFFASSGAPLGGGLTLSSDTSNFANSQAGHLQYRSDLTRYAGWISAGSYPLFATLNDLGCSTAGPTGTPSSTTFLRGNCTWATPATSATPADNAACTAGQLWFDASYLYVCTASGTVKRSALATY